MSNFYCEHCGTAILEGEDGHYITGCEHYPLSERLKPTREEGSEGR